MDHMTLTWGFEGESLYLPEAPCPIFIKSDLTRKIKVWGFGKVNVIQSGEMH